MTLERSTDWSWEDALAIYKPHSKNLKSNIHFNGNLVDPIDCEMKYCNSFLIWVISPPFPPIYCALCDNKGIIDCPNWKVVIIISSELFLYHEHSRSDHCHHHHHHQLGINWPLYWWMRPKLCRFDILLTPTACCNPLQSTDASMLLYTSNKFSYWSALPALKMCNQTIVVS